jgi:hypothetical protein
LIAFVFPIALCYFVFVVKPTQHPSPSDRLVDEELEMSELAAEREVHITQSPRSSGNGYGSSNVEIPSHTALFSCLLPYRTAIISTIFILFVTMITTTILVNLIQLW